jgi:acyl-CoA synthetase (AMP-forming)/AMP-acid ligase II/acyl carrier protein
MSFTDRVDQPATLVDILHHRTVQQPEQLAYTFLVDGEDQAVSLTYGELGAQVKAIALHLQSCCNPGDRAVLLYPPGLDYVVAFLGCLVAGVVAVPAYPPRPKRSLERIEGMVVDAQAAIALTTSDLFTALSPQLAKVPSLQALQWVLSDEIEIKADIATLPKITPADLAFLQYTSGSTAQPKGVMIRHSNLVHNLQAIHHNFGHSAQSCGVIWLPPYHDMGLIGGILQPLYGGFPVVLMSPLMFVQSPVRWLRAIAHYRATTSGAPNFAYELACDQCSKLKPAQLQGLDLSSWKIAFNGAEPINADVMAKFAHIFAPYGFNQDAFYPCYGMAEATLMVTGRGEKAAQGTPATRTFSKIGLEHHQAIPASHASDAIALVSSGQSLKDQTLKIVDPQTQEPLADSQVGEIWVAGQSIAQGYWQRPEETTHMFGQILDKTFLRTGDLGFLEAGELFVTGRLKELLIMRGRNHYPQDIEQTVKNCHPSVSLNSGAAFAISQEGIEQLVVMQEVDRSAMSRLNADEVLGAIRQAISEHHDLQVHAILLLKPGSIPKTSSGKIQRYICREKYLASAIAPLATWIAPAIPVPEETPKSADSDPSLQARWQRLPERESPQTEAEIEDWLVTHLALYLKVPASDIDISQPFAYYGLDSSVAVSLTGELASWLCLKELDPTLFWEYPSIEALAQHLSHADL